MSFFSFIFFNLHTSLKVSGYILKLTYLPARCVANSPDNKSLLDPVIKIETFFVALKEFIAFSQSFTF